MEIGSKFKMHAMTKWPIFPNFFQYDVVKCRVWNFIISTLPNFVNFTKNCQEVPMGAKHFILNGNWVKIKKHAMTKWPIFPNFFQYDVVKCRVWNFIISTLPNFANFTKNCQEVP